MTIKEILEMNPVLITTLGATFVSVCGALGVKELLKAAWDRWCRKEDEKDSDHKQLEELSALVTQILDRLDAMAKKDEQFMDNDMLLLEDRILFMQRKAIQVGKVSKSCMPRYHLLYKRYLTLNKESELDINEEIELNNRMIEKMFEEGKVVENFWDYYEKEA